MADGGARIRTAATAGLREAYSGSGAAAMALPVFTPPPLGGAVAVPPGALDRIFKFVQTIKSAPAYTEAIGLQLGIVGEEDGAENPLPTFTITMERGGGTCECVRIVFNKYGRDGVVIQSRRDGDWELLAIDLSSPYLDDRPLLAAGQPEVREYRLQYYEDAAASGGFTNVASVTVAP